MEKDREAFEASGIDRKHSVSLRRYSGNGEYISERTHDIWLGWQAALAYAREEREPVMHPFAPGVEFYPLDRCYVWRRESTQEWVLELEGTINDCYFNSRHTQPLSVKPEDVPGLPTRYEEEPVTESSGCVFRDLNVSPPKSGSWFTKDVRRASEQQEKFNASRPSALAMVRDLAWREKGPALIEAARKASSQSVVIGVDLAVGPDTAAWYCPTCGSSGVVKPGSPLNVSPPEKD